MVITPNPLFCRADFDEGLIESLSSEEHLADLHTITAVLKMYFRELPNPLLTYQLYESFAVSLSVCCRTTPPPQLFHRYPWRIKIMGRRNMTTVPGFLMAECSF